MHPTAVAEFDDVLNELRLVTWLLEDTSSPVLTERKKEYDPRFRLPATPRPPGKGQSVRSILRTAVRHLLDVIKKSEAVRAEAQEVRRIASSFRSQGRLTSDTLRTLSLAVERLTVATREMFFPFTKAREGIKTVTAYWGIKRRPHKPPARTPSKPLDDLTGHVLLDEIVSYAHNLTTSLNDLIKMTTRVRDELRGVSKSDKPTPEIEAAVNHFLDYRDMFGPLVYKHVGGIQRRLNELQDRSRVHGGNVQLEEVDALLETLVRRLVRPLRSRLAKRDPVVRASRRLADKASPQPSTLAWSRRQRLRQRNTFKNRTRLEPPGRR